MFLRPGTVSGKEGLDVMFAENHSPLFLTKKKSS